MFKIENNSDLINLAVTSERLRNAKVQIMHHSGSEMPADLALYIRHVDCDLKHATPDRHVREP
jgi:hypothetical protein